MAHTQKVTATKGFEDSVCRRVDDPIDEELNAFRLMGVAHDRPLKALQRMADEFHDDYLEMRGYLVGEVLA